MESQAFVWLAAFGGGMFAAAIGALPAFIFTGFAVLVGVGIAAAGGGPDFLTHVAFGPAFGPHISFAGGVGAAAFAARTGWLASGREITRGLMGLRRPQPLFAGGLFGLLGALINDSLLSAGLGSWTDTIALTVVLSALVARLAFGRTGLFGTAADPGGSRFQPNEKENWLPWQETPGQVFGIGLGMGILAAWMGLILGAERGGDVLGFGIAAASLIFLQFGVQIPVTHHIALPAAVGALLSGSLLVGAAAGVAGAFVGELYSRLFLIHGDTHIDPPAAAIFTVIAGLRVLGAVGLW